MFPIFWSFLFFLIVIPIIKIPIVIDIKKAADATKCKSKMVTGNIPTKINEIELIARRHPPIFTDNVLINPIEKINPKMPANIKPLLKINAEFPSAPRSLSAWFVHSNQGEYIIAINMVIKKTKGVSIPQIPENFFVSGV